MFDERDNVVEVLGRLANLAAAQAAYEACMKQYPDKRISLRQTCREIRASDRDR